MENLREIKLSPADSQLVGFLTKKFPENTILVTTILIEQTKSRQNSDLPFNHRKL